MRSSGEADMTFTRRAFFVGGAMGAIGLTLAGRLAWLSAFQTEKYKLLSEENRVSLRLIAPRRGWIVDRAGKPLALNQPAYSLELVPEQVGDLEATLRAIMRVLPLTLEDLARIRADVAAQRGALPVAVRGGLSWQEFAAVSVRLPDLPGVIPVRGFSRAYAGGEGFAHLLGYVGAPTAEQFEKTRDPLLLFPGFRIGKDGVERMMDSTLRGTAGARRVEVNARGRIVRDLDTRSDRPGETLKLTIDRDLQSYAARRLTDESGSVIVMDCVTGELLCMTSMPAYDADTFSRRVPQKLWDALQADDHTPLLNKSAMGLYPPGSTFKMMTALAVLDAGIPPSEGCNCSGRYKLGSNTWHCHKRRGHGRVDMLSGLYKSCDVYFYTFGRAVGMEAIATMARRFGLGQKFDLPIPAQARGIVPDNAWKMRRFDKPWSIGETLNSSIGQGYLVTNPLQLAVMTARLASGRAVEPRLIAGAAPAAPPLGIAEGHLEIVRRGMIDVVNGGGGTARGARLPIEGIRLAGKTGTAQVRRITMAERRRGVRRNEQLPWRFRDHALFVAYAPADAPRYAISVIVEHGSSGSKAAAPIARDVATYLFEPARALKALEPIEVAAARRRMAREAGVRREVQSLVDAAADLGLGPFNPPPPPAPVLPVAVPPPVPT